MENDMQNEVLNWFGSGRVGQSSKAMALAVAGANGNKDHPWDPDDLNRCLLFLEAVPQARQHMDKVAALSPTWARLVERWDEIEQTFIGEAGRDWCKARSAPVTYKLMKSVIGS
jgi:hypothetical protein